MSALPPLSPATSLAIVGAIAVAGTLAAVLGRRGLALPVVVIDLVFGVILGPQVAGLKVTAFLTVFSDLGLAMLFFCAGYEIDFHRIAGRPLRLGAIGWVLSLAIAYALAGLLHLVAPSVSVLFTGSALATTAIGTLIPILSDEGHLETRFGTYLLAAGAAGEFGPILLMTLLLSSQSTLHQAGILLAFGIVAVGVGWATLRSSRPGLPLLADTMETSSQLAIRWLLVLVFALALLADKLGLDLLLGGFASGVIVSGLVGSKEAPLFEAKLAAVAFGVFIPFFFIVSGMQLDVAALFSSVVTIVHVFIFLAVLLIARAAPALLLYRDVLSGRERRGLAWLSATQLPLVLAITTLAVQSHHMTSSLAAQLVGAAVLSTLAFPLLGLRVLGEPSEDPGPA